MCDVQSPAALDRVCRLVADVLELDAGSVGPDADFYDDLAATSLEKVEIAVRVEREFGIPVTPEESAAMTSPAAVLDLLRARGTAI